MSRAAVSQGLERARRGGAEALRTHPHLGASARLTESQTSLIPDSLARGADAYGFRGAVWTCDRVAKVIAREFGVRYHKAHDSRILKQPGWAPQPPITSAIQRDDDAIGRWREEVWPALKKSRGATTAGGFSRTNRGSTSSPAWSRPTAREGRRRA